MAFFKKTELAMTRVGVEKTTAQCSLCGLYRTCLSPKMKPTGQGQKKILIVAEAPGEDEDVRGIQLVGKSGQELIRCLARVGVDMRRDCVLTNALICRPPDNKIADNKMVDYCRPNLLDTIKAVNPETIILLGGVPMESLLGWLYKESSFTVETWAGWSIPAQRINAWVCPTWHPSYILRERNEVLTREFTRHLGLATRHEGRPWSTVPNYPSQVEPIISPAQAAMALRDFYSAGPRNFAFDFETATLKPESPHARIVTCSVSDGKRTFAYPWHGETIQETLKLLNDPRFGKIASNMPFEDSWVRIHLKSFVNNWKMDTMLGTHVQDSRGRITSIKFQAFTKLGQPSWDQHIAPYLKAKGGNGKNQIHEIDLPSLLVYNGMDSLMEFLVARKLAPSCLRRN